MEFVLLADYPEYSKQIAQWYFDEWDSKILGVPLEKVIKKVSAFTSTNGAPMLILAMKNDTLVGAAELKFREMDIYPDYEHWLGGVYVDVNHRNSGIGLKLANEAINRAKDAGIAKLYLQTVNLSGGIYSSAGFQPLEKVHYKGHDVLVMVAELNA